MQDKEGGTYTPDTQEDEDSIGSARLRPLGAAKTEQAPLTLIISGIFLVILLLLVVIFYNSKLSNNNRLPQELGAEVGTYKDAKVIEAQPIKEDDLIKTETSSDSAATKLAPDSQAPSSVTPSAPASQSAASAPSSGVAPEIQAALTPKTNPQPLPPAAPALKPVASTPAPKPVTVVVAPPKPVVAAAAPKPVPAPVVAAKPAPAPVAAKPVATGGTYAVQIGAFGSDDIANQQLRDSLQPSGASKIVEKVDVNGKTYYRAFFKGFASKDQAKAFCDKLKGAGKSCFVK